MRSGFQLLLYFILLVAVAGPVSAQTATPDTSFVQLSKTNAEAPYHNSADLQWQLYVGSEYFVPVKSYVKGHQYFTDNSYTNGKVLFDGTWYSGIPMLYDVAQDELVITNKATGLSQTLVKQHVTAFELFGHTFANFIQEQAAAVNLTPGFYDVLYDGDSQVLAQRVKVLEEKATTNGMEGNYNIKDRFFLLKDGIYYPVSNKRSVLKVLGTNKKQLNKFARTNNLRFKQEREKAIVEIARHFDTLAQ